MGLNHPNLSTKVLGKDEVPKSEEWWSNFLRYQSQRPVRDQIFLGPFIRSRVNAAASFKSASLSSS